jgi:hypothetical protein
MKFEPFVLYNFSESTSYIHSIWGEFQSLSGVADDDPQLVALERTLESMRRDFPGCFVLLEGDSSSRPATVPHLDFESKYVVGQHNGKLVAYKPTLLHLLDVSTSDTVNFAGLVSAVVDTHRDVDIGVATLFSNEVVPMDRLKETFGEAVSLESLRSKLLSLTTVFLGFDHDAFFTLESRHADFVEEVLRSARLDRERKPPA